MASKDRSLSSPSVGEEAAELLVLFALEELAELELPEVDELAGVLVLVVPVVEELVVVLVAPKGGSVGAGPSSSDSSTANSPLSPIRLLLPCLIAGFLAGLIT